MTPEHAELVKDWGVRLALAWVWIAAILGAWLALRFARGGRRR